MNKVKISKTLPTKKITLVRNFLHRNGIVIENNLFLIDDKCFNKLLKETQTKKTLTESVYLLEDGGDKLPPYVTWDAFNEFKNEMNDNFKKVFEVLSKVTKHLDI